MFPLHADRMLTLRFSVSRKVQRAVGALLFAAGMTGAHNLGGQSAPIRIDLFADSIAAAGDTSRAYALLDSALRANKNNGPAWHQFGLLNWHMAMGKRSAGFISDQRTIRLLQGADSALRLATQFSPDSARFWLSLGTFNLESGVSTMRFAAGGQASNALDAATRVGDTLLIARAADEVGMSVWRRYEPIANRGLLSDGQQKIELSSFSTFSRDKARDFVDSYIHKIKPPTGDNDYKKAFEYFRTAVSADPTSLRYNRHLYMAFGERGRWNEMLDAASRTARTYPLDYQSQLARGLALHRLGDDAGAQVAFDSAFVLMDDAERDRLTQFTRILRPKETKATKGTVGDARSFAKLPPEQQRGLETMYWFMNDPLTLTTENEFRLEFLSRVVWADFRWTSDDMKLRGADTDRGDVYVRYGPPDLEVTVPGASSFQASNTDGGVTMVWAYRNGMVFFFDLAPGFGTARFAFVDRDNIEQIISAVPVTWDNIASTRMIDTIPIRVAQFRAGNDSTDAVVTTRIPVDSLVRGLDVTAVPVDIDFRVFDQYVRVKGVESNQRMIRPDTTHAPIYQTWQRRLGPGINVVRVEALQADSKRAARAMSRLNPVATTGFGMSDVLIGNKPTLEDGVVPRRWRDITMTPNYGAYVPGASVGLVWEMYDLSQKDGSSKYRVAIVVERADRSALGGFTARIVDGLGRTLGRQQSSRDKLTITYDRSGAAAPTIVEFMSIDMSVATAGAYRMRIEITDLGNGKKTFRQTDFVVR